MAAYKGFDVVKCHLMVQGPTRPGSFCLFACQQVQDMSVFSKVREECSKVVDKTQK